jgi:hypothetical protein
MEVVNQSVLGLLLSLGLSGCVASTPVATSSMPEGDVTEAQRILKIAAECQLPDTVECWVDSVSPGSVA